MNHLFRNSGALLFLLSIFFSNSQAEKPSADYLLALPRNSSGVMPVIVALPGQNVAAKDDQNNWKFLAAKNGFALINMEVDYDSIKAGPDVDRLHDRIFEIIRSLKSDNIKLDEKHIYLVGTSRGGMMTISLFLRYPKDFVAASIVCGGRLRYGADQFLLNAQGLRFYLAHGAKDNIIPIDDFYKTREALESHGATVASDIYPESGHILSGAYRKAFESLTSAR